MEFRALPIELFVRRALVYLENNYPEWHPTKHDDYSIELDVAGFKEDGRMIMGFSNAYRIYRNSDQTFEQTIESQLETIKNAKLATDVAEDWERAREHLAVQLRRQKGIIDKPGPLWRKTPYKGLVELVVLDFPFATMSVKDDVLVKWGLSRDAIFEIARFNTLAKLPKFVPTEEPNAPPMWFTDDSGEEGFAATILLFPERIVEQGIDPRRLWVACPVRDIGILFEAEVQSMPWMVATGFVRYEYEKRDHPLTPCVFQLERWDWKTPDEEGIEAEAIMQFEPERYDVASTTW